MIMLDAATEKIESALCEGERRSAEALCDNVKSEIAALEAVDTGRLLASAKADGNSASVSAPYAGYVEYGTSKMAAKPFMTLALTDTLPRALEIFGEELAEVL